MTARALWLACWCAAALAAQDERAVLLDPADDADARCRALVALQQRGELDSAALLAALGDAEPAVGATAAAILRHAWVDLPPELLRGLDADRSAARRFLRELAYAPRPAAVLWTETWVGPAPGRSFEDRCFALAARGRELGRDDVDLLLEAAVAGDTGEAFRLAVMLLPPARADALVGRVHALLLQGAVEPTAVTPLLDRLSARGVQQLLGIAGTLPTELGATLLRHVAERDPAAVRERARAALDGEAPLEEVWLRYAAPLLGEPARRERVLGLLADDAAPRALQRAAFAALLEARDVTPRVVAWARAHADEVDGADDLARLIDEAIGELPEPQLVAWLEDDPDLAQRVVRALPRRERLGAGLERTLLRLVDGAVDGAFATPATTALLQRGSERVVRDLWPQLRGSERWAEHVETLARRGGPFAHELLLLELAAPPVPGLMPAARQRGLDAVRLGLVALGDRRQLAELVEHAATAEATFVRRCAYHARPLPGPLALRLLERLPTIEDADRAAELAAWAASSADPEVMAWMERAWTAPANDDAAFLVREVALRALVAGPPRQRLVAAWREQVVRGPLPEHFEALPFELVATMPERLGVADLRLLAELVLLPPLGDSEREHALAQRWPDGRHGFALPAAVGQRLLGADAAAAGATFADVVATIAQDPRHRAVSRPRLLVLWRTLIRDRDVLASVGAATASLYLSLPGASTSSDGPAHWLSFVAAAGAGAHEAAARHARAAQAGLLWHVDDGVAARLFVGERDPGAGVDPWAALAAAPFVHALALARAADDPDAIARAARAVRELAGHDAATRAHLTETTEDPNR